MAESGHEQVSELVNALRKPRVGADQLALAAVEVERLCTAYASQSADTLAVEVDRWMGELTNLVRAGRVSSAGHREVIRLTGWLTLLRGCLCWDQGDRTGAQQARVAAEGLADDLNDGIQAAWAWEIRAWMALTEGNLPQVITAADEGIRCAPHASVAAQLHAQKAKAHARMKDKRMAEVALDQIRNVLDTCPIPANIANHFIVDPAKASFYAMDVYRTLPGADLLADAMAETVISTSTSPSGTVISPMRLAEAQLTKAVLLARNENSTQALQVVDQALAHLRVSAPSLTLVVNEVSHYSPAEAAEFRSHLTRIRDTA